MITKTLTKAVAGTAAVGAMMAPAAMTVAPQISNMACAYPNTAVTKVDIASQRNWEKGDVGRAVASVTSEAGTPNGDVRLLVIGPDRKDAGDQPDTYFADRAPLPNDGTKGFDLPDNLRVAEYVIRVKFFGHCRFMDSSDKFRMEVERAD